MIKHFYTLAFLIIVQYYNRQRPNDWDYSDTFSMTIPIFSVFVNALVILLLSALVLLGEPIDSPFLQAIGSNMLYVFLLLPLVIILNLWLFFRTNLIEEYEANIKVRGFIPAEKMRVSGPILIVLLMIASVIAFVLASGNGSDT